MLRAKRSRRPKNDAEQHFFDLIDENDLGFITKRGWPDFVWQPPGASPGEAIAVEVKNHGQKLRDSQSAIMEWLSYNGVDCYVYTPKEGLIPFDDLITIRAVDGAGNHGHRAMRE